MTYSPTNSLTSYLPNAIDFSEDIARLTDQLTAVYSLIATAVNVRDISYYLQQEQQNGGQLFTLGNPLKNRYMYRQSYFVDNLPNTGIKQIAHNLDFNNPNLEFVKIYGAATYQLNAAIPLPYVSADPIYLSLTSTNIEIETLSGAYINYSAIVTLEYVKG